MKSCRLDNDYWVWGTLKLLLNNGCHTECYSSLKNLLCKLLESVAVHLIPVPPVYTPSINFALHNYSLWFIRD